MDAVGGLDVESMNEDEKGKGGLELYRRQLWNFYHIMSKSYIKDKQIMTLLKCCGGPKNIFSICF